MKNYFGHEVSEIKEESHDISNIAQKWQKEISDTAEEPYKDDYSTCLEKTCIILLYCIIFSVLSAYWLVMVYR